MTLGYPSADALQRDMTSRQFTEWNAFLAQEYHGYQPEDYRMALQTAYIVNVMRDPKSPPLEVEDVLDAFDFWPDEPVLDDGGEEVYTDEEIAAAEAKLVSFASILQQAAGNI